MKNFDNFDIFGFSGVFGCVLSLISIDSDFLNAYSSLMDLTRLGPIGRVATCLIVHETQSKMAPTNPSVPTTHTDGYPIRSILLLMLN